MGRETRDAVSVWTSLVGHQVLVPSPSETSTRICLHAGKTKAVISSPTPISTPLLRPLGPQVLAACFHRNLSRLGLAATPDCQHRIGIKSNHSAHPWIVRRACIAVLRRFKTPPISCPLRKDNYIATMPSWTTEDVLFRRTNDQHLQDNFPRS
jgi:hypothetical protein